MSEDVRLVEFSLFSSANPSGYDEEPDFDKACWPLIQTEGECIDRVIVTLATGIHRAGFLAEDLRVAPALASGVFSIGRFADLGTRAVREVRTLMESFDLAVFLEVSASSILASRLLALWRHPGEVRDAVSLGTTDIEAEHLRAVVQALGRGNAAIAFRTEGTSMVVLAHAET
jgi:hypothetical protein